MKLRQPVRIAIHKDSKKIVHIDNAINGLSCNCICLECGEELEAIQGSIYIKHFRHYSNLNCKGAPETGLHKLGKQILFEGNFIFLPKYGKIEYNDPLVEKPLGPKIPDVTAWYMGIPIYFEVVVTNKVNLDKRKFYIESNHKSIEIFLNDCFFKTYEEIKDIVLNKLQNKNIIFWEKDLEENNFITPPKSIGEKLAFSIILFSVIYFIYSSVNNYMASRRTRNR